ncbi:MAG: oligoribonuclease [Pseudomonadales bacterium]
MTADLVWMDLEMTGLDPEVDRIIEIATIITNSDLEVIAEGPVFAIKQPQSLLAGMDDWNQKHHSASGLLDRMAREGVTEKEAEALTLKFIEDHVEANTAPLCGNTIWQDRRFLSRYMQTLEGYLHYRMIDVSSVKELARRWRPDVANSFSKQNEHTALADIKESIGELRHYREHFFQLAPT